MDFSTLLRNLAKAATRAGLLKSLRKIRIRAVILINLLSLEPASF
jgi:hypothetical protein